MHLTASITKHSCDKSHRRVKPTYAVQKPKYRHNPTAGDSPRQTTNHTALINSALIALTHHKRHQSGEEEQGGTENIPDAQDQCLLSVCMSESHPAGCRKHRHLELCEERLSALLSCPQTAPLLPGLFSGSSKKHVRWSPAVSHRVQKLKRTTATPG